MDYNIKLNFVNRSEDTNNSNVVIFQKNAAGNHEEDVIAWKVIQNCGRLSNHPFVFPLIFSVSASDSYGNYTRRINAWEGQAFDMILAPSGDILQLSTTASDAPTQVEVRNNLSRGRINAMCYKDKKVVAVKTNIAPGQKAIFELSPRIHIGVLSQVEQGSVLNRAIISEINTEINLMGIRSADIVMTGGGPGKGSTAFNFTLENINE